MIEVQASRAQRLAIADDVLVNTGAAHALAPSVVALDRRYRALAQRGSASVESTPGARIDRI